MGYFNIKIPKDIKDLLGYTLESAWEKDKRGLA